MNARWPWIQDDHDYKMTARWLCMWDDCKTTRRWLQDDCNTTARWLQCFVLAAFVYCNRFIVSHAMARIPKSNQGNHEWNITPSTKIIGIQSNGTHTEVKWIQLTQTCSTHDAFGVWNRTNFASPARPEIISPICEILFVNDELVAGSPDVFFPNLFKKAASLANIVPFSRLADKTARESLSRKKKKKKKHDNE